MKTLTLIPRLAMPFIAAALFPTAADAQFTDLSVTNELKLEMTPGSLPITKLFSNGCFYSLRLRVAGDTPLQSIGSYAGEGAVLSWDAGRISLRAGIFTAASLNPWAMGTGSVAFGLDSTAWILGFAGGAASEAGWGAFAFGQQSKALGGWSGAIGDSAHALNGSSFAAGGAVTASGGASVALNAYTLAAGHYSLAAGLNTRADACSSFVVGRHNVGGAGPNGGTQWNPQDPIFEIGIGEDPSIAQAQRKNAFTVYKDGRVNIPKRQGDILMGEFGNPGD